MKPLCLLLAFAPLALATTRANADTLYPGGRDVGKISLISKGVKELGADSLFLVNYSKTGSGGPSSMRLTALGSGVFRYFVVDNVALTLSVGGLYRMFDAEGKATDVAFTGSVGAAYHASVGGGMFVAPSIGVGGLYGGRKQEVGPLIVRDTVSGVLCSRARS